MKPFFDAINDVLEQADELNGNQLFVSFNQKNNWGLPFFYYANIWNWKKKTKDL